MADVSNDLSMYVSNDVSDVSNDLTYLKGLILLQVYRNVIMYCLVSFLQTDPT